VAHLLDCTDAGALQTAAAAYGAVDAVRAAQNAPSDALSGGHLLFFDDKVGDDALAGNESADGGGSGSVSDASASDDPEPSSGSDGDF